MSNYHIPVLLHQCVEGLNIQPDGVYVDVTFGGGGHSREILKKLSEKGRLIAFDQDVDAEQNLPDDSRMHFFRQNFRHLKRYLRLAGYTKVDGILADLGISSYQIDTPERGFSTRYDERLDMRMSGHLTKTAASILNEYSRDALKRIFSLYGEVKNAGKLSTAIVEHRASVDIGNGKVFRELAEKYAGLKKAKYLAQVYQALRIEVNEEMESLKELLEQSAEVLKEEGRLVVIAYQSLEDRLVKNFLKTGNFEGKRMTNLFGQPYSPFEQVNRKLILPDAEELEKNKRARSARLRIGKRTAQQLDTSEFKFENS